MKLIDKDAVVEEIEKLISNGKIKCQQSIENNDHESYTAWSEHIATCGKILSFINTLEVKEVDLEEEIYNFWDKNYRKIDCGVKDIKLIGEHFFELGLKVQKGE